MNGNLWMGVGLAWILGCAACGPVPGLGDDGGDEGTGSDTSDDSSSTADDSGGSVAECECQPVLGNDQWCQSDQLAAMAPGCGFDPEVVVYELDCVYDDMGGTQEAMRTCDDGDAAEVVAALQSSQPAIVVVNTEIYGQEFSMDAFVLRGDGTGTTIDCYSADAPPAEVEVVPSTFVADDVVACLQMDDTAESVGCIRDAVTLAEPLAVCE